MKTIHEDFLNIVDVNEDKTKVGILSKACQSLMSAFINKEDMFVTVLREDDCDCVNIFPMDYDLWKVVIR